MSYYYDGTITDVCPGTGVYLDVDPGGMSIVVERMYIAFDIDDDGVVLCDTWYNAYQNGFTIDILEVIASRIPTDIYESRDIRVLEYVLNSFNTMINELSECMNALKSRMLGGKRAIN